MTLPQELQPALDERLSELAAEIVRRVGFDPPEVKTRLQPPKLRVAKGPYGLNCYCVAETADTRVILIGSGLYPFLSHYTRAAAAFLLPSEPNGIRPSTLWPRACSATATTLDWLSSPCSVPLYPEFGLSPNQEHAAYAFGACAYRFALCHEIAHVALAHLDNDLTELRKVDGEDIEEYRKSQEQELIADRVGLRLHVRSLPPALSVTGLASAVYFVHATALLDVRLMLLASLVDYHHWRIPYTHPPALHRVQNLMGAAESLERGAGEGLGMVHDALAPMDAQLRDVANRQQELVTAAALGIVSDEVARYAMRVADDTPPIVAPDTLPREGTLLLNGTQELRRLLDQSPLGVLRALESPAAEERADRDVGDDDRLRFRVVEQLALALPEELRRFRRLTRSQRAQEAA